MHFPLTRSLTTALLAAASIGAGAQTLLTQIPLPAPSGLLTDLAYVSADSAYNRVYVAVQAEGPPPEYASATYLLVYDGASNQLLKTVTLPVFQTVLPPLIDIVRNLIYIPACNTYCSLLVVDRRRDTLVKTIALPQQIDGLLSLQAVIDPTTGKVYVSGIQGGYGYAPVTLAVLESEETGQINVYDIPEATGELAMSPYAHRIYFPSSTQPTYPDMDYPMQLTFFDTLSNQVTEVVTFSKGGTNGDLSMYKLLHPVVNTNTGHIFGQYNNYSEYKIAVLDSTGNVLANMGTGFYSDPQYATGPIVVDPKKNLSFALVGQGNGDFQIAVVDGDTNTIAPSSGATLTAYEYGIPPSFSINPDTSRLYITYVGSATMVSPCESYCLYVYSEQ